MKVPILSIITQELLVTVRAKEEAHADFTLSYMNCGLNTSVSSSNMGDEKNVGDYFTVDTRVNLQWQPLTWVYTEQ